MSDSDHEQPDPFELRLQFNDLLRRLTASQDSIARAVKFASQWRKHCDVLYTVLLEAIQQSANANQKMNLFYLCDHICQTTLKNGFKGYVILFTKDILSLVQMICPHDNLGKKSL
ncbi:hypothetical protein HMI54_003044 [Coelomomyces lativittatus]|nr:hypothetical protein HMI54_003044 [Coelomomyces lativittatus]